jgi:GxxExxY protein
VHRIIGPGLPESIYQRALSHELGLRGIAHVCESPVPVHYKGRLVGEGRLDLLVAGKLIVELKSVTILNDVHRAQAIAYLQAIGYPLALIINFNVAILKTASSASSIPQNNSLEFFASVFAPSRLRGRIGNRRCNATISTSGASKRPGRLVSRR